MLQQHNWHVATNIKMYFYSNARAAAALLKWDASRRLILWQYMSSSLFSFYPDSHLNHLFSYFKTYLEQGLLTVSNVLHACCTGTDHAGDDFKLTIQIIVDI